MRYSRIVGLQNHGVHVSVLVRFHHGRALQMLLLNLTSLGGLVLQNEVHLCAPRLYYPPSICKLEIVATKIKRIKSA